MIVADEQAADAARSVELVGSEGEGGGMESGKIDRNFSDGLNRVDVQGDIFRMAGQSEFRDRLEDAGFVVGEHQTDQRRVGERLGMGEIAGGGRDFAVGADGEQVETPAAAGPVGEGRQDAGMFEMGGNDTTGGGLKRKATGDRQIVGLGPAAGEEESIGLGAGVRAKHLGDFVSGVFEEFARAAAGGVLTGGVGETLLLASAHRLLHFREQRGGAVVIEVDRIRHGSRL